MDNKLTYTKFVEVMTEFYYGKQEQLNKENMEKYYTPEIEDIRVGYECEIRQADIWERFIVTDRECLCDFVNMGGYRTSYLTKEQIEAEGWSIENILEEDDFENDIFSTGFTKYIDDDNWYSLVQKDDNKIIIYKSWYRDSVTQLTRTLFYGECKSINEFRYIMKLLKLDSGKNESILDI